MTKILNFALKIKGVVGRVVCAKSSDPATPSKNLERALIRENIWTAVLKYGPNEVRSSRKAKVQIFSCMGRTNWSIRALLSYQDFTLFFDCAIIVTSHILMRFYF